MSAVSIAASKLVVATFEAMKLSICCSKACCRDQSRKVCGSGFFDDTRQRAVLQCLCEASRALFKPGQIFRRVCSRLPGIFEPCRIEVADDGLSFTLGGLPTAPVGRPIGEVPR